MKNKITAIVQWCFSALFWILALVSGGVSALFFVLAAVLLMPIKPIKLFKSKLFKGNKIIPIILVVAFVITGFFSFSADENKEEENGITVTEKEDDESSETKKNSFAALFDNDKKDNEKESEKSTTKKPATSDKTNINSDNKNQNKNEIAQNSSGIKDVSPSRIPSYTSKPYVVINNNIPEFTASEKATKKSFERYSSLDYLGRCGVAFALIGKDIMPTGNRGEIGQVKPTGWHTVKYDCVDGKYLYNRCHLIGWQLSGENANTRNLITGTRYMNVEGMLPFENMVDDYIEETNNHVLYRVTPVFKGNELVCRGVQIEAYSVEDNGDGICFNVYCFNVQPGVKINYTTGSSALVGEKNTTSKPATTKKITTTQKPATTKKPTTASSSVSPVFSYVINTHSQKIHYPYCSSADDISAQNRLETSDSRQTLIDKGYSPCGRCKP